jgi:glycosyltransferase involved in cell wall biosynthesis
MDPVDNTNYMPLVSVVIPTYNRPQYVTQAIDSVLNQTYPNIEVLVINDGSTDNTLDVLASYKDRIRIVTKQNAGLSAARNTGIRESRGELIAFLDDDDRWLPHKLTVQAPLFADPKVNLVHTAGHFFDESNGWENIQFFGDVDFHDVLDMKIIYVQSVIARKTVFDDIGFFDEALRSCEDVDMWLRISSKYRMTGIDNCTVDIRCHAASMQHNIEVMYTSLSKVLERNSHYHGDCALCRAALARSLSTVKQYYYQQCKRRAHVAMEKRQYGQAIKMRLWAFRYDPMALPKLPYNGMKYLVRKLRS